MNMVRDVTSGHCSSLGDYMNWALGDVYIIFGDEPRADGCNIYGVFKSESSAEDEILLLKERKPWVDYHIEEFGLWE